MKGAQSASTNETFSPQAQRTHSAGNNQNPRPKDAQCPKNQSPQPKGALRPQKTRSDF
jgi:hypothetical protein